MNVFSIIIDLESPKNWFGSHQAKNHLILPVLSQRPQCLELKSNGLRVMRDFVLWVAVAPPMGQSGHTLIGSLQIEAYRLARFALTKVFQHLSLNPKLKR